MRKICKLAVICAAFSLMFCFTTVAYAIDNEEAPGETTIFTPDGTGTVIDRATDENGKQFYTIITPAGNAFYLIIDLERAGDNVYFLDAVTENDLLALAEQADDGKEDSEAFLTSPKSENTTEATQVPEAATEPSSETEQKNNAGMLLIVLAVVVIGGGAGYYFKIYRPKHQQADSEDVFDYGDGRDFDNSEDSEQVDDQPPWDDENDEDDEV